MYPTDPATAFADCPTARIINASLPASNPFPNIERKKSGITIKANNNGVVVNNINFALLAYNDTDTVPDSYGAGQEHAGTSLMDLESMKLSVQNIRNTADIVIVSMHSGTEYSFEPNSRQIEFAHGAIDAGADLVYGHHPHVLQPVEEYNGKIIMYSLGNFVFDQMWSEETKESIIANVTFSKEGVEKIEFTPLKIYDYSQPRTVDAITGEKILSRMKLPLSEKIFIQWDDENNKYIESSENRVFYLGDKNIKTSMPSATSSNGNSTKMIDLNNDDSLKKITLENGKLKISDIGNGVVYFESPSTIWIDSFAVKDITNDGKKNLVLSVWKEGSFGSAKPFWEDTPDDSIGNHLFVYEFSDKTLSPVWQSSKLGAPNCSVVIGDVDNDNSKELIVLEGSYADYPSCEGAYIAIWEWNGWGFTNFWRSEKGAYNNLQVDSTGIISADG